MRSLFSHSITKKFGDIFIHSLPWIIFIIGIWLVVIKPFGPHWEFVPGDIGDARFNNYILEHFYRWISGVEISYWSAPFFFPFQNVIAFSDNLLGSAPFYVPFRWVGLDRETAFQGWYVLSFCLNYFAATYALSRLRFHPLALGIGAFFFTFGLPILAQETHPQLFYRFCIPLASYYLWRFLEKHQLRDLAAMIFWLIWQFYLTIYLGIFLSLLLAIFALIYMWTIPSTSFREKVLFWPKMLVEAWSKEKHLARVLSIILIIGSGVCFLLLMQPYFWASRHYGLTRSWSEILLPNFHSYLNTSGSPLWVSIDQYFNIQGSVEQRLFPGGIALLLIAAGIVLRFKSDLSRLAWICLGTIFIIVLLTLKFNTNSAYWFLWNIPVFKSIRAVGRVQLVLMWPIALYITWVVHEITRRLTQKTLCFFPSYFVILVLLISESTFYNHSVYSKADAQLRLARLAQKIPSELPPNPILFFADNYSEHYIFQEIDAMIISQEMGIPTLNGYSGNFPPGAGVAANCVQVPKRITQYMKFENISRKAYYLETIKHIVPIGFQDCDPSWWNKWPW